MLLEIKILSGERTGKTLVLNEINIHSPIIPWLKENEAIELCLNVNEPYTDAEIILYDHTISVTKIIKTEESTTFIWVPKSRWNGQYEYLFLNYFGIAEFTIKLMYNQTDSADFLNFQPIEILASKVNSKNVDDMLSYLSNLKDDELHSILQTTKYNSGFKEGINSPYSNLERLEYSFKLILSVLPDILKKPITKLSPRQKIINPSSDNIFDDSSLGWLMSNLSVLDECDDVNQSHLTYSNKMYRASSLQILELEDNHDIYENWVIHGFLKLLTIEISKQLNSYENLPNISLIKDIKPDGYFSFFEQLNKFKKKILHNQIVRCENLLKSANRLKFHLDIKLPVSQVLMQRPILTPKAISHLAYRSIFIEFINWFEKITPDWSAYENLFAIKSIPILFESYCYYRVAEVLTNIFSSDKKIVTYWKDNIGNEITLFREPIYWMNRNSNVINSDFVNTEGATITKSGIRERSHIHKFSHRRPDIAIEITFINGIKKLIILDAKYTNAKLAMEKYLPECTMKYVHGIHSKNTGVTVVDAMGILFPNQKNKFYSFHSSEYNIFSKTPVNPSLQCIGLNLSDIGQDDVLLNTLKSIFENSLKIKNTT
ncbi:hypothetical protein [Moellerella wisconsensis]|uniref:hypothetical protein n=1 Tax=Moellerella wisconsensis TaxID=158849 RepID=UPI0006415BF6|nr:hypothetical protein [Moellerella wisconsensis]KLN96647.1 hypothetical protein VK86_08850 [Moellerella wisconsensis]